MWRGRNPREEAALSLHPSARRQEGELQEKRCTVTPLHPPPALIGATGFEPATARPPAECATRLRHAPRAGDRTRTGTKSLEGSCATVTPRPRGWSSLGDHLHRVAARRMIGCGVDPPPPHDLMRRHGAAAALLIALCALAATASGAAAYS